MSPRKNTTYSSRPNHAARAAHAKGAQQFRTYDTSHIRPKKSKGPAVLFTLILLVVVGAVAFFGVTFFLNNCSGGKVELLSADQAATITVAEGSGAQQIGNDLADAKLVAKGSEFTSRVSARAADAQLKAGTYVFAGGVTVDQIIDNMIAGPDMDGIPCLIPEGFTLEKTAARVEEATSGAIKADDFKAAASDASKYVADYPFLKDAGTNSLEGYLFPKTYGLHDTDTADTVIRMMLSQFAAETSDLDLDEAAKKQGLKNSYELVTLASIIEKEATGDEQNRADVAGVFYNRLQNTTAETAGFLQSDATTAYEVGHDPSAEEVHADTPYSTYTHKGLCPTPICSAGLDSLTAACEPNKSDYLYFYFKTNDKGELQYFFSKTYDEHQAAIANN